MEEVIIPKDAPEYYSHRLKVWDEALARQEAEKQALNGTNGNADENPIKITLPDGSVKEGIAGKTTSMDIAMGISETLGRKAMVAIVNGEQWDMDRQLVEDCTLKICDFNSAEGKNVLWHSTAHMLGEALEMKYQGELCIGPPLEDGFYYDIHLGDGHKITEAEFDDLTKRVEKIAKEKRKFQRLELTKNEARDMFSYNKFKLEIIEELNEDTTITAYRDGPFIDLCRGPHVPQTTRMKAMMCKSTGQAYWRAKSDNPSLQRVYGISFPDKKELKEYKTIMAEAAKRDHRVIGPKQELIMFNQLSPGCPFFLPNGQRIFNRLQTFLRGEYWRRGYEEVQTPNMFDFDLWHTSGHAANYKENMFQLQVEGREYGLKPMNCPSHCLMFASRVRSHRELPWRLADFGVLHRNELSGSLGGLTRVRRFQQDDSHIFCLQEQVRDEVYNFLQFMKHVYDIFGFTYELDLSTRPENYLGEIEQWDIAESMLTDALVEFTGKQCGEKGGWALNPGDGAFYGPKIDIKLYDALRRRHQCATLQLDFQLPVRFNLQVQSKTGHGAAAPAESTEVAKVEATEAATATPAPAENGTDNGDARAPDHDEEAGATAPKLKAGFERPVIIHRAIYGSLERFFAILIEHYGGYWPFWLSPRQSIVVPISEKFMDYAREVQAAIRSHEYYIDLDTSDRTIGKKMAEARNMYYNTILVVGEKEVEDRTVNMRVRGVEETKTLSVEDVLGQFKEWTVSHK